MAQQRSNNSPIVINTGGSRGGMMEKITTAALIIVGIIGAKKYLIDPFLKKSAQDDIITAPEAQQAGLLYDALNIGNLKSANITQLYAIASTIEDFNSVQAYYAKLYPGRNLVNDLQKHMNSSEYQQFLKAVTAQSQENKPTSGTYVVNNVYNNIPLYITPDASKANVVSSNWWDRIMAVFQPGSYSAQLAISNVLINAPAYDFLGWATGDQYYDIKSGKTLIKVKFKLPLEYSSYFTSSPYYATYQKYAGREFTFWVKKELIATYSGSAAIISRYGRFKSEWVLKLLNLS